MFFSVFGRQWLRLTCVSCLSKLGHAPGGFEGFTTVQRVRTVMNSSSLDAEATGTTLKILKSVRHCVLPGGSKPWLGMRLASSSLALSLKLLVDAHLIFGDSITTQAVKDAKSSYTEDVRATTITGFKLKSVWNTVMLSVSHGLWCRRIRSKILLRPKRFAVNLCNEETVRKWNRASISTTWLPDVRSSCFPDVEATETTLFTETSVRRCARLVPSFLFSLRDTWWVHTCIIRWILSVSGHPFEGLVHKSSLHSISTHSHNPAIVLFIRDVMDQVTTFKH